MLTGMSISRGRSVAMRRLQKKTPGTMSGSTQWSPDQLRVLSLKTLAVSAPTAHSQELR
jgi:hypothetical protein